MISEEQMEKVSKCRNNRKQIILYQLELSRRVIFAPTIARNVAYTACKGMRRQS